MEFSRDLIVVAGFPAAIIFAGVEETTAELLAITLSEKIVTPFRM
jgi:hypothetical protein